VLTKEVNPHNFRNTCDTVRARVCVCVCERVCV
jgi:hypothetical protein